MCMFVCMYMGIQMLRLCGGSGAAAIGPPTLRLRASFAVSVAAGSGCCCRCFCCCSCCFCCCWPACLERGNFFNVALFSDIIHMPGNCSSFRWGWEQLSFKSEKDYNEFWHHCCCWGCRMYVHM